MPGLQVLARPAVLEACNDLSLTRRAMEMAAIIAGTVYFSICALLMALLVYELWLNR